MQEKLEKEEYVHITLVFFLFLQGYEINSMWLHDHE